MSFLTCFMSDEMGKIAREAMCENSIPTYEYPETLAVVLDKIRQREATMPNTDAYRLLELFGIRCAKSVLIKSLDESERL